MQELWNQHKKTILIVAGVAAALAAVVGAVIILGLGDEIVEEVPEVTSAWPVAERERAVEQPPEPVRWPLTGLDVTGDESPVDVRIVSVKIENSPSARPQTGLDHADIVYESLTEGGITRFNALFHSRTPADLGPVRSARMSDIQVVPQYSALFAHSGANQGVLAAIRSAGLEVVDHGSSPAAYRRVSFRAAPHNLYADVTRLREIGASRGYSATQELKGMDFSASVPAEAPAVTRLSISFSPANSVVWQYDESTSTYLRSNNGQAHTDRESGEQYAARNVVVMWARTSATGPRGTLEIALTGSGRASVFRDGVRVDGEWQTDGSRPPTFRDEGGSLIRLAPGNTWFQVVPLDVNIVMQ